MMRLLGIVTAGAALLCIIGASAQANLVGDGGFESPVVAIGGFTSFATGDSFSSWTVGGAAGKVAIVSTTFAQSGFSFLQRPRQHVEVAAPDVPEPALLALFSAGLLALGMIRGHKRA